MDSRYVLWQKKEIFWRLFSSPDVWGTLARDRIIRWVSAGVPVVLTRYTVVRFRRSVRYRVRMAFLYGVVDEKMRVEVLFLLKQFQRNLGVEGLDGIPVLGIALEDDDDAERGQREDPALCR